MASAGDEGVVRLWDASTGRELHRLTGAARSLAFSPDGRLLATADFERDGRVRLWDVTSGREARPLEAGEGLWECVAFAPDGNTLACCGPRTLLLDVTTGKLLRRFGGKDRRESDDAAHLAFAPGGKVLATACAEGAVRLWHTDTGKEARRLVITVPEKRCHTRLLGVAFSPDGRLVAACGELPFCVWEADTGRELPRPRGEEDGSVAESVAFSADGRTLALARRSGQEVARREVSTGRALPPFSVSCPLESHSRLTLTPDGAALLALSGALVRSWDLTTGAGLPLIDGHSREISRLSLSPDGKNLV